MRPSLRLDGPLSSTWRRRCVSGLLVATLTTTLFTAFIGDAADAQANSDTVRIVARKLDDGRVESGLQQRLADNSWSDRMLPSRRFFPTTATAGRWLASSALALRTSAAEAEPATPVEVGSAGHAACRPTGGVRKSAGFPLSPSALAATGTVRVAVLFLDFPNASAAHSTRQESDSSLAHIEEYLERSSYGTLDLQFDPLHRWLRAEHETWDYNKGGGQSWRWDGEQWVGRGVTVQQEAVRLADPHFDFADIDMVLVVMPSSHLRSGAAGFHRPPLVADGNTIEHAPIVNSSLRTDRPVEPRSWGGAMAHEMANSFGLVDL